MNKINISLRNNLKFDNILLLFEHFVISILDYGYFLKTMNDITLGRVQFLTIARLAT